MTTTQEMAFPGPVTPQARHEEQRSGEATRCLKIDRGLTWSKLKGDLGAGGGKAEWGEGGGTCKVWKLFTAAEGFVLVALGGDTLLSKKDPSCVYSAKASRFSTFYVNSASERIGMRHAEQFGIWYVPDAVFYFPFEISSIIPGAEGKKNMA